MVDEEPASSGSRGQEAADRAREAVEKGKDAASDAARRVREAAGPAAKRSADAARDAAKRAREAAGPAAKRGADAARSYAHRARRYVETGAYRENPLPAAIAGGGILVVLVLLALLLGGGGAGDTTPGWSYATTAAAEDLVVTSQDGNATLTVPAGSVPAGTRIGIGPAHPADVNGTVGPAYALSPSGLTFASSATLTVTLPASDLPRDANGTPEGLLAVLVSADGNATAVDTDLLPADPNATTVKVTLSVPHFSEVHLVVGPELLVQPTRYVGEVGSQFNVHWTFFQAARAYGPFQPVGFYPTDLSIDPNSQDGLSVAPVSFQAGTTSTVCAQALSTCLNKPNGTRAEGVLTYQCESKGTGILSIKLTETGPVLFSLVSSSVQASVQVTCTAPPPSKGSYYLKSFQGSFQDMTGYGVITGTAVFVDDNGSGLPNISVSMGLKYPNGTRSNASGMTDGNGSLALQFRIWQHGDYPLHLFNIMLPEWDYQPGRNLVNDHLIVHARSTPP